MSLVVATVTLDDVDAYLRARKGSESEGGGSKAVAEGRPGPQAL